MPGQVGVVCNLLRGTTEAAGYGLNVVLSPKTVRRASRHFR
jgi:hypothetical protein